MVATKILWLLVLLDGDNSYILFCFEAILLSLVTRFTIVANIQVIALLDFVLFKFESSKTCINTFERLDPKITT